VQRLFEKWERNLLEKGLQNLVDLDPCSIGLEYRLRSSNSYRRDSIRLSSTFGRGTQVKNTLHLLQMDMTCMLVLTQEEA